MAHGSSNPAAGKDKRRSGKQGAYDPRFVQRGEKINPQSKENFSSSFLIRGVVVLNVASGCACESLVFLRKPGECWRVCLYPGPIPLAVFSAPPVHTFFSRRARETFVATESG